MDTNTNNKSILPLVEYKDTVLFYCEDVDIIMEYYTENIIHWIKPETHNNYVVSTEYNIKPLHSDTLQRLASIMGPTTLRSVIENLPYVVENGTTRVEVSVGTIVIMALQIKTCKEWPSSGEEKLEQFQNIYKRATELSTKLNNIVYVADYS